MSVKTDYLKNTIPVLSQTLSLTKAPNLQHASFRTSGRLSVQNKNTTKSSSGVNRYSTQAYTHQFSSGRHQSNALNACSTLGFWKRWYQINPGEKAWPLLKKKRKTEKNTTHTPNHNLTSPSTTSENHSGFFLHVPLWVPEPARSSYIQICMLWLVHFNV